MQFRTSCGAVNLLISRAPPRNFAPVLIMYDQILTKNPARPGGREREGKKEERGIARFNKTRFREEAKRKSTIYVRIIADLDSRN